MTRKLRNASGLRHRTEKRHSGLMPVAEYVYLVDETPSNCCVENLDGVFDRNVEGSLTQCAQCGRAFQKTYYPGTGWLSWRWKFIPERVGSKYYERLIDERRFDKLQFFLKREASIWGHGAACSRQAIANDEYHARFANALWDYYLSMGCDAATVEKEIGRIESIDQESRKRLVSLMENGWFNATPAKSA